MDKTIEKLENYLIRMDADYENPDEGMWIVHDGGVSIAIKVEGDIVFFRINMFPIKAANQQDLFKRLLELNSTSMILGAYGIEDNKIVLIDSLTTENIDFNEFQASIESLSFAAVDHYQELKSFL